MGDVVKFIKENAIDEGYLQNWYQDSLVEESEPIWTDEHISEVCDDFYLIPKEVVDKVVTTMIHEDAVMKNLNKCAVSNVKDHLFIQMHKLKDAEKQAILDGKTEKCIEMYNDMTYIYRKLMAELS